MNGSTNNGGILLGNGTLQPAIVTHLVGLGVATDLGDLDGDRDLDLALADEFEDEVLLYRNGGNLNAVFANRFESWLSPGSSRVGSKVYEAAALDPLVD